MNGGTVLVTGATGFLGRNLLPVLVRAGWTVRALHRRAAAAADLRRLGARPALGDLAGFRVNVGGTRAVLAAARAERVPRVVHVGSANSFGPAPNGGPTDERTPFRGRRYGLGYVVAKQQAQRVALGADPPAIVVNPTFLFGAHDRAPGAGRLIRQLARSPAVYPYPAGRGRNVAGAAAVACGVELALRRGAAGECYVLGGADLSYRALFEMIRGVTASRTRPLPAPGPLLRAAGAAGSAVGWVTGRDPGLTLPLARAACESFHYSSAKAARELGYVPDDAAGVVRAIRASFDWLRRTGRIPARTARGILGPA